MTKRPLSTAAALKGKRLKVKDKSKRRKKWRQDASTRFYIDDAGEQPGALKFETMEMVASLLRYERLGPVGIVYSKGLPDPWGQRGH